MILSRLANSVSRLLDERDREAVLGDLAESGETPWQTLRGVAGLVLRREAESWPSWLAATALSLPGGLALIGFSLSVGGAYGRALDPTGVAATPGLSLLVCNLAIVAAWRWAGGRIAGPLGKRTVWMSAALAFAPCVFCITRFDLPSTSRLSLLLLIPPALLSVARGRPLEPLALRPAIAFAAVVTALTVPSWSRHGSWLPNWALSWPAWYLVITAQRRSNYARE
ncbi:MAG: hypothetical protein H6509_10515 [Bryobacterales bacterium]|nr:hypothetical protein [Acidobacteriota bacterium]MCB9385041.1 hypothetical protein [Bryobacterales bacterium]